MAAKSLSYTVHSVLLKDAVSLEDIMLPKSRFLFGLVWEMDLGVLWKYVFLFLIAVYLIHCGW